MRELSTPTNWTRSSVAPSSFLPRRVCFREVSANVTSIPGVSTSTGQQTYVAAAHKAPFHWR